MLTVAQLVEKFLSTVEHTVLYQTTFYQQKVGTNFADKRRRLTKGRPNFSSERTDPVGLRWRKAAVTVNYRPVLSSERALQNNKPATI
jgi:hypothetical protein